MASQCWSSVLFPEKTCLNFSSFCAFMCFTSKKHILTSVFTAQNPNTGQNIQRSGGDENLFLKDTAN